MHSSIWRDLARRSFYAKCVPKLAMVWVASRLLMWRPVESGQGDPLRWSRMRACHCWSCMSWSAKGRNASLISLFMSPLACRVKS